jgi:hypothetical protein
MNEKRVDVEQALQRMTPRGAPARLRREVLQAIDRQLSGRPAASVRRVAWLAVAATLVLGLWLNHWASQVHQARMVVLFGPEPLPASVAELVGAVQSVTDAETGRWMTERLLAGRRRSVKPSEVDIGSIGPLMDRLEAVRGFEMMERAWEHEGLQNPSKTRRDRSDSEPGNPGRGGDTSDCQRDPRVEIG